MNSRVHVRAEWEHEGKRHVAESFTRVVNPYGCMVIFKNALDLEHRLSLTNLATGAHATPPSLFGEEIPARKAGNTVLN